MYVIKAVYIAKNIYVKWIWGCATVFSHWLILMTSSNTTKHCISIFSMEFVLFHSVIFSFSLSFFPYWFSQSPFYTLLPPSLFCLSSFFLIKSSFFSFNNWLHLTSDDTPWVQFALRWKTRMVKMKKQQHRNFIYWSLKWISPDKWLRI